jgi:nucleoside-diphosphate-sugar epimerase
VIYHIAGVLGKRGIPLSEYEAAHITLTAKILKGMCLGQKIIYMSSAYVTDGIKDYEMTKLAGEKLIWESGFDYAVIRPSFIYGEGDLHHLPIYQWIQKWQNKFLIFGDGNNIVAPLYIQDLIDDIDTPRKLHKTVAIAGEHITMNTYISKIAQALKVKEPHIHLPDKKIYHSLLHGDFFTGSHPFDSDFKTTDLDAGLANTVRWYKQKGYLK